MGRLAIGRDVWDIFGGPGANAGEGRKGGLGIGEVLETFGLSENSEGIGNGVGRWCGRGAECVLGSARGPEYMGCEKKEIRFGWWVEKGNQVMALAGIKDRRA